VLAENIFLPALVSRFGIPDSLREKCENSNKPSNSSHFLTLRSSEMAFPKWLKGARKNDVLRKPSTGSLNGTPSGAVIRKPSAGTVCPA
jgi:hypothetical protein